MLLYPRDFRRHYRALICQLVQDASRDARDHRRRWAGARFWIGTVSDLFFGAVAERAGQLRRSAGAGLVRPAGLAAALGGTVFLIGMVTPLRGPLRPAVPASIVCMALGALGLYRALRGRSSRLERLGLALAGIGLGLGFLGMAGSAAGILQPNPVATVINTGEHAGLVFIGAGMSTWGILAVRTRALGRLSFTPGLLGILGLAGTAVVIPRAFAALEASVLPLAFAAAWILLGLALLINGGNTARQSGSPTETST